MDAGKREGPNDLSDPAAIKTLLVESKRFAIDAWFLLQVPRIEFLDTTSRLREDVPVDFVQQ